MIPKIIHYIWIGDKPLDDISKKCIASWEKYLKGYTFKLWNEQNFDFTENTFCKEAYAAGKFAFVSDYMRLKILYTYGGIYMDTDMELLKRFPKSILQDKGFLGWARHINGIGNGSVMGAEIIGTEANSTVIKETLDVYENIKFIDTNGKMDLTMIPQRLQHTLLKHGLVNDGKEQVVEGMRIYPSDYFYPKLWHETSLKAFDVTQNTYAYHHYRKSWYDAPKTETATTAEPNYFDPEQYKAPPDNGRLTLTKFLKTIKVKGMR